MSAQVVTCFLWFIDYIPTWESKTIINCRYTDISRKRFRPVSSSWAKTQKREIHFTCKVLSTCFTENTPKLH